MINCGSYKGGGEEIRGPRRRRLRMCGTGQQKVEVEATPCRLRKPGTEEKWCLALMIVMLEFMDRSRRKASIPRRNMMTVSCCVVGIL